VNSPAPKPEVILTNFFAEPTVLLVPIISRAFAQFLIIIIIIIIIIIPLFSSASILSAPFLGNRTADPFET
jgi:hypothetical protein